MKGKTGMYYIVIETVEYHFEWDKLSSSVARPDYGFYLTEKEALDKATELQSKNVDTSFTTKYFSTDLVGVFEWVERDIYAV